MKIALFADIHSNYLVFKKAFENTKNMNIDKYIFLGDYVTDGFDANKILDIIKSVDGYVISGNREATIIDYHNNKNENWNKYIQTLPIYKIITINDKKICISHGAPYNVREVVDKDSYDIFDKLIKDYNCDIYLFGHRHKYYCANYKGKYFINPGSIGLPTKGLPFKYGILNITDKIEYEKMEINYEYKELEDYYKNSDYYNKVTIWCSLLLEVFKSGENHIEKFMNFVQTKAKNSHIDISNNIPDDLFVVAYNEYMKEL